MRTAVLICAAIAFPVMAAEPRPVGQNCDLLAPPASAGEEANHGMLLRIFPRAKDIDATYSGCQVLFASYEGKWVVVSLTEIVKGDPVRLWSEHDKDAARQACRYRNGRVVRGNPDTCPASQFLLVKSLAPGCFQKMEGKSAGAPPPPECEYE